MGRLSQYWCLGFALLLGCRAPGSAPDMPATPTDVPSVSMPAAASPVPKPEPKELVVATAPPASVIPSPSKPGMQQPQDTTLSFALSTEQLGEVEIFMAYLSSKTGAGRQEIRISGSGEVQLLRTVAYDKPELTQGGHVSKSVIVALLTTIELERFFALQDKYPQDLPGGGRFVIRVGFPGGRSKQVAVDVPADYRPPGAFAHTMGAIKLTARLGHPDATRHKFFPRL